MTDIVERLRKFYGDDTDNWLDADEAEPIMLEAADEIERLRGDRAQLVLMTEQLRTANQEIERLRAEIERETGRAETAIETLNETRNELERLRSET